MIASKHQLVHPAYVEYLEAVNNNQLADVVILDRYALVDFDYNYYQNSAFHEACIKAGIYSLITKTLVNNLAKLLEGKRCLEVMAGRGRLTYHLNQSGIDIVATDNNSWSLNDHNVIQMTGLEAVRHYYDQMDMLVLCWPPMTNDAFQIIKAWGTEKPILIGGELGGCCGDDLLYEHFNCDVLDVGHVSLSGIYDDFHLGYFRP